MRRIGATVHILWLGLLLGLAAQSLAAQSASPSAVENAASEIGTTERIKAWSDKYGVELLASMKADASNNWRGGATTRGVAARYLMEIGLGIGTDAWGLRGGRLFATFQNHAGKDGSILTGDAQAFSNMDGERRVHLYEFWFEQTVAEGKLRFKFGRVDANTE